MVKRKLTRNEREEVKNIFKKQRQAGRCRITKELNKQADILTKNIDTNLKKLNAQVLELNKEKTAILREAELIEFESGRGYCSKDEMHPDLIAYDEETDRLLVELLTEETIPTDVKAVLTKALEEA